MLKPIYNWKRFWCPREGKFDLSDGGYLSDPEGEYSRFTPQDLCTYEDISSIPCLVLLGEPGIGKTTALTNIVSVEHTQQKNFLHLDLGEYSSDLSLRSALFDNEIVKRWKDSSETLTIFLDSLDECAIPNISKILTLGIPRIYSNRLRLRIACRTAVWPTSLEEVLHDVWKEDKVGIYELAPLTRNNVKEAAFEAGIAPDDFIAQVARVAAQPLAIKPVSLRLLLNLYQKEKQLPSDETDLYEKGCYCFCEELKERKESSATRPCDPDQRYFLAQRIAYTTFFAAKYGIWCGNNDGIIPLEDIAIKDLTGLDLFNGKEITVNEAMIKDTLNTGLFTARAQDRLGWAHYTYAEYLASQYLLSRLSPKQRQSLLMLSDTFGAGVVPHLSEVASRVALKDEALYKQILDTAPSLLLKSDVLTGDYQKRAALIDALLTHYESGKIHFRELDKWSRLKHLFHPALFNQLIPVVIDKERNIYTRMFALDVLEACEVSGPSRELTDLALDEDENVELRCSALRIMENSIEQEDVERIKPLAKLNPNDQHLRIKGCALQVLWPKHISTEDLFGLLTPVDSSNIVGEYEGFTTYYLPKTLSEEDLPFALAWLKETCQRSDGGTRFRGFLNSILVKAWNSLDKPGILPLFVDVLWECMIVNRSNIFHESDLEDIDFAADDQKRHVILKKILSKLQSVNEHVHFIHLRESGILAESDYEWVLENIVAEQSSKKAEVLARLSRCAFNRERPTHIEALLEAYRKHEAIRAEYAHLVEAVAIDSDQAKEMKERDLKILQLRRERENKVLLDPPPKIRVQQRLTLCEKDNPSLWPSIVEGLTLKPDSQYISYPWDVHITDLPGWQEADEGTRLRIRYAAQQYILSCNDTKEEWLHIKNRASYEAIAGYQAFRLVLSQDPDFIKGLSADIWKHWTAALLSYPLNINDDELQNFSCTFITEMFSSAPRESTETLRRIIERENSESSLVVLRRVKHIKNKSMATMLQRLVDEFILTPRNASQVMTFLLDHDINQYATWVLSFLRLPISTEDKQRNYSLAAAVALCSPASRETWPIIWDVINSDIAFGHSLTNSIAFDLPADDNPSLNDLTDVQLSSLYLWVAKEFPHKEDPKIRTPHSVSVRERISHWRDGHILGLLKNRGTISACNAIEDLLSRLPDVGWIRFTLLEAINKMRLNAWKPLTPKALKKLTEKNTFRHVSSDHGLMEVVQESLNRLEGGLHGQNSSIKFLWDHQKNSKTWVPKDENSLSDFICTHLDRELIEAGIIVNREVQIRPALGIESGQRSDILVEAAVPGGMGRFADIVTMIIEIKGCWHNELKTAMKTQLVERYLRDNSCQCGLYVVGWYQCDSWDNDDDRKKKCLKTNIEGLSQYLRDQASSLSRENLFLEARVLDLRLDKKN